ncbi:xanthine dehydrogenase molybdopterin binding subunit [Kaistia dalseonensis]|uniref:Xanthine dehydrogenase large subunit n=1 Tax=Kaistia dalseonensis TaxID=410840 RepID=A0ABU0H2U8_9HYPH|nr:xanthine dehydrogenase molybdopterin binding subunit [Kaistia dalseonensis]MCX5494043.1 xanthine dehydrogenase molybdopterin binding subunit [Kaistia dalseonensis]MDQ0436621.1 xanthine dehydrogenase large subunit [Kaistia dalseonensis]
MDTLVERKAIIGGMSQPHRHDSGHKHVAGSADYIDDLIEPAGTLHAYLGLSTIAHGEIVTLDLDAVRAAPGVVGVLTADDIPGERDISPSHKNDEPVFAAREVTFSGQPLFVVLGETREAARRAARLAKVTYRELPPVLDVAAARLAGDALVTPGLTLERGDVVAGLADAPRRVAGSITIGGQEHFYLEGQIALAIPGEDRDMVVHSSAQHPDEVQRMVARVLGVADNAVTIIVRRMGGGFGGKESQSNLFACIVAIAARTFKRAVKLRPDRDDDIKMTGKRHDFVVDYDVGFDDAGRIEAVDAVFAARCGHSADLSRGVTDRALTHSDNAYFYPAVRVRSLPLRTNTVSNTAFRGYGGPQGMLACERWIEDIAYALGKDPLEIRKANFYGEAERNVTPYHQTITDNILERLVGELEASADYARRRAEILAFNEKSPILKRGIALIPLKFGISFTMLALNQAGALVHVYRDGSVHLNHGGTEMGQGLHTKIAQVVADVFQIDLEHVKVSATATDKVPNASSTAASSGSDLNGMAAENAAQQIRDRLIAFAAEKYGVAAGAVLFEPNAVVVGDKRFSWAQFAEQAYLGRVQLSAAGFYKTPGISWNRDAGRGKPFLYFAYGASCSEVTVDTLTGEYMVDRVDILHDVGRSLNPAIDIGQIEGGFIQGMGWLTTEELWWDAKGQLRTHAPSTYKIPVVSDVPRIFNVRLAEWSENRAPTIGRSKAVGEPPFMLALSVFEALGMAAASVADYRIAPRMDAPATPERVLLTIERLKRLARGS